MRTDGSDDHTRDTGVDHAGPGSQGVGRAAGGRGDDDPCEEMEGGREETQL